MKIKDVTKKVQLLNDVEKRLFLSKVLGAFVSQDELGFLDNKTRNIIVESFNSLIKK